MKLTPKKSGFVHHWLSVLIRIKVITHFSLIRVHILIALYTHGLANCSMNHLLARVLFTYLTNSYIAGARCQALS